MRSPPSLRNSTDRRRKKDTNSTKNFMMLWAKPKPATSRPSTSRTSRRRSEDVQMLIQDPTRSPCSKPSTPISKATTLIIPLTSQINKLYTVNRLNRGRSNLWSNPFRTRWAWKIYSTINSARLSASVSNKLWSRSKQIAGFQLS